MNTKYDCLDYDVLDLIAEVSNDIQDVFTPYGFLALKNDLWELAKAVIQGKCEKQDEPDFSSLLATLDKLIEGAWQLLEYKNRLPFYQSSLNMLYDKNPYFFKDEDTNRPDICTVDYLIAFEDQFTMLTKEEVRDCFIALGKFFSVIGILDWKWLLKKWTLFINSDTTVFNRGWDYSPLTTYEYLLKLVEALYLVTYWSNAESLPECNEHLFIEEKAIIEMDYKHTRNCNPLQQINWSYEQYNASILKDEVEVWFACSEEKERLWNKDEPAELIKIYTDVVRLLEAGWLLTQSNEIPISWLHSNGLDPKQEENSLEHVVRNLTKEQCDNIHITLANLYKSTSIGGIRRELKDRLWCALQTKEVYDFSSKIKKVIMPIIEVLYLINLEVCSRPNK